MYELMKRTIRWNCFSVRGCTKFFTVSNFGLVFFDEFVWFDAVMFYTEFFDVGYQV